MSTRYWKDAVALAIGLSVGCLLAEAGARVYFAFVIGPRVLLYGTDWYRNIDPSTRQKRGWVSEVERQVAAKEFARKDTVEVHGQGLGGYSKFFPNEIKTTKNPDTGERIPVTINSSGFRGREFSTQKAAGVVRVLTMGASSTFGYYNHDDETYPFRLEQLLNERCAGTARFEVINFAIPHATSTNVANMLLAEGIALTPDVVTFYEGRNDSVLERQPGSVFKKLHSVLVHRLLLAAFIDQVVVGERVSLTDPSLKLGALADERSRIFLRNMTTMLEAGQKNGFQLIVASQQATSKSAIPGAVQERMTLRGISFDTEVGEIQRRMEGNEHVNAFEYSLLIHHRLMADLRQWAKKRSVPFVDVIGALDQDRHYLLSWVHLHPDANRVVATKLAEPIMSRFCTAGARSPR